MNETYNSILGLGKNLGRFARNQKSAQKRIHILEGMSQKWQRMQQKDTKIYREKKVKDYVEWLS